MENVRQIMPSDGWRVVTVSYDTDEVSVYEDPVIGFALLSPPYAQPEDMNPEVVVPMIRVRGVYGNSPRASFEIVLGNAAYWEHMQSDWQETFIGYLGPGETQQTPWVKRGIEEATKFWVGELDE